MLSPKRYFQNDEDLSKVKDVYAQTSWPLKECKILKFQDSHVSELPNLVKESIKLKSRGPGVTVTLIEPEESLVIMYGGVLLHQLTTGEAWTYPIPHMVRRFPREVYWYSKDFLEQVTKMLNIHRVQGTTLAESERQTKFMERVGFNFSMEGVLKAYGANKEDYKMWGAVCQK